MRGETFGAGSSAFGEADRFIHVNSRPKSMVCGKKSPVSLIFCGEFLAKSESVHVLNNKRPIKKLDYLLIFRNALAKSENFLVNFQGILQKSEDLLQKSKDVSHFK